MDWREPLRNLVESQAEHPRRLLASSVGVFGGAAALVVLLAAGTGFREFMHAELSSFGRGVVFLNPAITSSGFHGVREGVPVAVSADEARRAGRGAADVVEAVLPEHMHRDKVLVESAAHVRRLPLSGTDERYAQFRGFEIAHGRFFDARDIERRNAVAAIGHGAAVALFGAAELAVGQRIRVAGQRFEVVGVAARKGRQYFNVGREDNDLVMVPISSAETRLGFDETAVSRMLLYPRAGAEPERAVRALYARLGPLVGFHPEDLDAVKWSDTTRLLSVSDLFYHGWLVFIGLAGTVTLLIGGIGIANYQLAILSERSVEIAVAKAIGARDGALMRQTLLEAGLVGGSVALLGVVTGIAVCAAIAALAPHYELPTPEVSPVVVAVTGVAVVAVTAVASLLPALRVRRMEVSAALRSAL